MAGFKALIILVGLLLGVGIVCGRSDEPECDGDCLGCKHLDVDCNGDGFTDWLLTEADDNEW